MKNWFLSFISLALIILLIASCISAKNYAKTITIESEEIPPAMKTDDFVLIGILKEAKRYDDFLINEFSRYTGTYVLSKKMEIGYKYTDLDKYRYLLDVQIENYINGIGEYTGVLRFYIYDRKIDKKYLRKTRSTEIRKEIRAYLLAIDYIRKK